MPSLPSPEPAISCFDDLDFFKAFENEFPAIVYNDALTSKSDLLTEPNLNPQHIDKFDLNDETSLSRYDEDEQNVLYFNDLFPCNIIRPYDLRLENDNDDNDIDIIQSSEDSDASASMPLTIKHLLQAYGHQIPSRVHVFDFGGLPDLMAEGLSARMLMEHKDAQGFIIALGLHKGEEMESLSFSRYWAESTRHIPDKGDLRDYWIGISSAGDFLGTSPSYTMIRDPILRLCHRLIACSIAGRSQALEKVTATDLFYLRGMDICVDINDTWAWVAMGPKRQPDDAADAPGVAQDAPAVDEGRMARLEEDVHEIRGALAKKREVIGAMARDFSRFTVWAASRIT
ncbi:hypothetical protein Tco_0610323 [Tanacetum coccineum]